MFVSCATVHMCCACAGRWYHTAQSCGNRRRSRCGDPITRHLYTTTTRHNTTVSAQTGGQVLSATTMGAQPKTRRRFVFCVSLVYVLCGFLCVVCRVRFASQSH